MLRLTPLEETISGQELIKNERIAVLTTLIQDKFLLSTPLIETVRIDLDKLDTETLALLVRQILHFDTYEQLQDWLAKQPMEPAETALGLTQRAGCVDSFFVVSKPARCISPMFKSRIEIASLWVRICGKRGSIANSVKVFREGSDRRQS